MKNVVAKKSVSPAQGREILETLKTRFEKNLSRHAHIDWLSVEKKLQSNPEKLWSLLEMEKTGGEPDVVARDAKTDEFLFFDCAPETPKGRVSVCYDRAGWESRKENRPANNAVDMAAGMGIELLTEEEYGTLQAVGDFDAKTSSWIKAPPEIRKLGGALYAEWRYGRIFIGHNGAQSYYAIRGFRGVLRV